MPRGRNDCPLQLALCLSPPLLAVFCGVPDFLHVDGCPEMSTSEHIATYRGFTIDDGDEFTMYRASHENREQAGVWPYFEADEIETLKAEIDAWHLEQDGGHL